MLDPAAAPEDHRGVPLAGRGPRPAGADGRGRAGRRQGGGIPGRGHRRVRPRALRGFLVPRGQHPAAGGAPGHRGGHRGRPGPRAASRGAGPAAVGHPGRPGDRRPRDRGPAVRRGPRRRVPARHRDPGGLVPGHGAAVPLGYRGDGGQRGRRRVRPDAGQGHRARADPRRGGARPGPCPAAQPDPGRHHQPGLPRRRAAPPRLPGRPHHDVVHRAQRRPAGPAPFTGGTAHRGDRRRPRRAGGCPGRRPGAGHAAQRLAQHRDAAGASGVPAWPGHRGGELRPAA